MSAKSDPYPKEAPSPIGEISQEPSALESFLDANQKKLVVVGILAILVLVAYVIYDGVRDMKIRDRAAAVAAARTVPDYEKVSEELSGMTAGGSALLLKAHVLWQDQQQQEAIATLDEFLSSYPEHPALGSAYTRLGSYQQQRGNVDEAKEAFGKAAELDSPASSLAIISLGDLARSEGDSEAAEAFYNRILDDYGESFLQVKRMARERIKLIGVNPPVEKAPEPPQGNGPATPGDFSPSGGLPNIPGVIQPADETTLEGTPRDMKSEGQPLTPTEGGEKATGEAGTKESDQSTGSDPGAPAEPKTLNNESGSPAGEDEPEANDEPQPAGETEDAPKESTESAPGTDSAPGTEEEQETKPAPGPPAEEAPAE